MRDEWNCNNYLFVYWIARFDVFNYLSMILILLAIIALAVSFTLKKNDPSLQRVARIMRVASLVLLIVGILSSIFRVIEPGYVGVKVLFGSVDKDILQSGLNVVNPLADVIMFDVKTQNYTMSGVHDEGTKSGDDAIKVLTSDGLEVVIDLTVLYKIIPAEATNIYSKIGEDYEYKIVRPITRTKIRDNAVYYDAISLYSKKRDEFQSRIYKDIENDFSARGLVLEQLLVRNITLPQSVKMTIESKINAEQEAQKMQFVLQKEQQEAERKRVEAQGIADYQKIINSQLSDKLLQYEKIKAYKELAESNNSKIIIMPDSKTPLILDAK